MSVVARQSSNPSAREQGYVVYQLSKLNYNRKQFSCFMLYRGQRRSIEMDCSQIFLSHDSNSIKNNQSKLASLRFFHDYENEYWVSVIIGYQKLLVAYELNLRRDLCLVNQIRMISFSFTVSLGHRRQIDEIVRTGGKSSHNFVDVHFSVSFQLYKYNSKLFIIKLIWNWMDYGDIQRIIETIKGQDIKL